MKTEISSGGVIVRKNNNGWEVLLIKDMNGNWTFPKGLVEKNESITEAATREIQEEVGLTDFKLVSLLTPIHYNYNRGELIQKTVHYFLFRYDRRESLRPQKEEGITDVQWFAFAKAMEIIGYAQTNKKILAEAKKLLLS